MTEEELEIIREFEKVLGMPKPPPPPDEESEGYEEYRNEGEAEEPDEVEVWQAEHRQAQQQEHTEQKVLHDEDGQVVYRDNEVFDHDKSKIYTEKPLIEEESIAHVAVADVKTKSRRLTHGQLIQAVKWAEILAKPKGMR
ncbi:MAG: hypothetical protein MJ041_04375 [Acidaminococcaceae bacterium]|nr:hypothetical protein [Acidaminococcaceae bacterium]